ncbi:hypothetical protein B484DRAFT_451463, partial [Ochromonadaceae sp. CCMP2298]
MPPQYSTLHKSNFKVWPFTRPHRALLNYKEVHANNAIETDHIKTLFKHIESGIGPFIHVHCVSACITTSCYVQERCMYDNIVSMTELRARLVENPNYLWTIGLIGNQLLDCRDVILDARISLVQLDTIQTWWYVEWNSPIKLNHFHKGGYTCLHLAAVRTIDDLVMVPYLSPGKGGLIGVPWDLAFLRALRSPVYLPSIKIMVRCPKLSAADQAARRRTMKALWTKTNRASNLQKTRDYTRVQARYDFDQLAFERDQHIQNEKAAHMCFCVPQRFKL